jgi:hypothetical protein
MFQWIEPFLIAAYGTPDPFWRRDRSQSNHPAHSYGGSSQRLAVSRYIGVGTYDTAEMPVGKILQVQRTSLPWQIQASQGGWYPDASDWAYEPLELVGLDINFNKHMNHGLELRIFDALPMKSLEELLGVIFGLARVAVSLDSVLLPVPQACTVWKKMMRGAIESGGQFIVEQSEFAAVLRVLRVLRLPAAVLPVAELTLAECYGYLRDEFLKCGSVDYGSWTQSGPQSGPTPTESENSPDNIRQVETVYSGNNLWCGCL